MYFPGLKKETSYQIKAQPKHVQELPFPTQHQGTLHKGDFQAFASAFSQSPGADVREVGLDVSEEDPRCERHAINL